MLDMKQRRLFVVCVVFLFSVGRFTTFGEEAADEGVSNAKEEYMQIFKNIPVLFEYLLVALQEKPEILETDNPMAFNDFLGKNPKKVDKRAAGSIKDSSVARIDDDIFDEVEGLDDPSSDEAGADKKSSEQAGNEESDVKITPQEIAEKYLMVEQMLEDYNKSK